MTDCYMSLEQVLKNTEFENSQQLKSIESEKERIEAYELRLESVKLQITNLDEQTLSLKETATSLGRQYIVNKDTINSLKSTSAVLSEHEEALKRKLNCLLDEARQERMVQSSALAKYETIWATYESEYNNMEGVKRVRDKQEKLNHAKIEYQSFEDRIHDVEMGIKELELQRGQRTLISWVIQIASLKVDTNRCLTAMEAHKAKALHLQQCILYQQKENKLEEEARLKQDSAAKELMEHNHDQVTHVSVDKPVESNTHPQSGLEPREGAKEPLLIFDTRFKRPKPSNVSSIVQDLKHNSVLGLPRKKEYGMPMQASLLDKKPVKSASSRSSSGFKYQLEMPTLSVPSRRTKTVACSDSSIITKTPTLPQLPSTPSSKVSSANEKPATSSTLSLPRFSLPSVEKHVPRVSKQTKMRAALEVIHTQPVSSQPTRMAITVTTPTTGRIGPSPQLPVGSSSNKSQSEFRFKVPKHPIAVQRSNKTAPKKPAIHPQTVKHQVTSDPCPISISCSEQQMIDSASLVPTVNSSKQHSSMDWSCPTSSTANVEFSDMTSDANPVYQTPISSNSLQTDPEMIAPSVATPTATSSTPQYLENSYPYPNASESVANCGDPYGAGQCSIQANNEDVQSFSAQAQGGTQSQDFGAQSQGFGAQSQGFGQSPGFGSQSMFGGDGGFSFGNFGQQTGGGFGGGFGFFGGPQEQQQQQQQTGSGDTGFGGFSFGGGAASSQPSSNGFNLNFGGSSDSSFSFKF